MKSRNLHALMVRVGKEWGLARGLSWVFVAYVGVVASTVSSTDVPVDEPQTPRYFSPVATNAGFSDSRGFAPVETPQEEPLLVRETLPRWVF